jgi:hypothetical protein
MQELRNVCEIFCVVTHCMFIVVYRRFGIDYESNFRGLRVLVCLTIQDSTECLSHKRR